MGKSTKDKVQDVFLSLCVDRSGSMGPIRGATVESLNGFLDDQRKIDAKTLVSIVKFDHEYDIPFQNGPVDLADVLPFGTEGNPYVPRGNTALYDAVAVTIQGAEAWLDKHSDFDGRVAVVIQTDGFENNSKNTTLDQLNELIEGKTAAGWDFVFMGAGEAAWRQAKVFTSIPASNVMSYAATPDAVYANTATASASLTHSRSTGERYTGSNVGASSS